MRFELSESAAALRDVTADLLATEAPPAVVRAGWPGGDREPLERAWRKLADVGIAATLVAEESGGLGLDETSLVPMLEAVGYSGLPLPVVETVAIAAPLLDAAGDPRLAAVVSGDALVAATLDGSEVVPHVQHAALLLSRTGDSIAIHDITEVSWAATPTVDGGRGAARVERVGSGRLLTDDPGAVDASWQRGVLGTSALLVGLAGRALDMTVAYVKDREQFGVPVGSFQAVKHALASALVAVEFARPVVRAAGWAQANLAPDAAALTAGGKVLASDAARLIARTAIQCHGAMGYTTEYDLHLYVKAIWALASSWGTPEWHRVRLAETLGV